MEKDELFDECFELLQAWLYDWRFLVANCEQHNEAVNRTRLFIEGVKDAQENPEMQA